MADSVEHEFGGEHTEQKLRFLEAYLEAYLNVMSNQQFFTYYVDAFAGTGARTETHSDGSKKVYPGSATIALKQNRPFDKYVFIDEKATHVGELEKLKEEYSDRNIEVHHGDANTILADLCRSVQWRKSKNGYWGSRGTVFLDPYGLKVNWDTLEAIAATKSMDLWFLLSTSGLFRNASKRWAGMEDEQYKIDSLTTVLGTDSWRDAWYEDTPADLFGYSERRRTAGIEAIEKYVQERLETIFEGWVSDPVTLKNQKNVPIFALFFAISNPDHRAVSIAKKIVTQLHKNYLGTRPKSGS